MNILVRNQKFGHLCCSWWIRV